MKTEERIEARRLRREHGLPIKEIARRVGVAVSSVSAWVHDIELTEAQQDALRELNPAYNRQRSGSKANAARCRALRVAYQEEGREVARRYEPLHVAGCMLYWAEGSRARNTLRFTNSDPDMVGFFVRFLRRYFDLEEVAFRVTCNLFADHVERQEEIEQFWLVVCQLPASCLAKSTVNTYSKYSKKKRQNKLPYGTCRITVCRTRVTQSIYGAIQEYAGFTREAWLE